MLGLCCCLYGFPTIGLTQDYLTEKEASAKSQKLFAEAKQHLNASRSADARDALEKILAKEPSFIDAQLMYADLQLQMGVWAEAETAFEKALALSADYAPLAYFLLASAELKQDKWEEGIGHLESYLNFPKIPEKRRSRAEQMLDNARLTQAAYYQPVPFEPIKLSEAINTEQSEYLPALTADESFMVFVRVINGREDFYLSKKENGQWQKATALENINSAEYNEGAQSISANGNSIVFTICDRPGGLGRCDLYWTEAQKDQWTPARNLGAPINSAAWESQPALSANGQELYFASDRKGGLGGIDIWVSRRAPDGRWEAPQNIGAPINTPDTDQAPFIHADGQTLYFMSNGHPGLGGFDLYVSRKQPDGTWGKPQNLGYPINTKANEGALIVSLSGKKAYFSTDRVGLTDSLMNPDNVLLSTTSDIFEFELYQEAQPQAVTYVKAIVKDALTGKYLQAAVSIENLEKGELVLQDETDETGEFLSVLPMGNNYALHVSKPGYLFHSEHFALANENRIDNPYLLDIQLVPIPEKASDWEGATQPIVLKNIFFETGSAVLLPESLNELERLFALLRDHPALHIQINGHTDDVGEAADNMILSENRAKAVYSYLLEKGIAAERLAYKGYGESQPIDVNTTAEGRQNNRRTTFEIIRRP